MLWFFTVILHDLKNSVPMRPKQLFSAAKKFLTMYSWADQFTTMGSAPRDAKMGHAEMNANISLCDPSLGLRILLPSPIMQEVIFCSGV